MAYPSNSMPRSLSERAVRSARFSALKRALRAYQPALRQPARHNAGPSLRLKADLTLLLVAAVWGVAFAPQRSAMGHVGPFTFAAARFALGGLALLPIWAWRRREKALVVAPWARTLRGGMALGLLLFGGASLQQIGLIYTTAGKGGFITGLYIVIVPFLLAMVWRERIEWNCWMGAGLATVGLFLLSVQTGLQLAPGDGWVLLGALAWALHVIAVGHLAPGHDPIILALLQYIVCALLSALAALAAEWGTWGNVLDAWPAVLYTGVCSIGLGYTLQVAAQRHTPATHTAIILSLESVFAALAGWLLLGELLTLRMAAGAGLMLMGIVATQVKMRVG